MTLPARIAFDPALTVKATSAFQVTVDRAFAPNEIVDWRALGLDEMTVRLWWMSGLVYCEPEQDSRPAVQPPKHQRARR